VPDAGKSGSGAAAKAVVASNAAAAAIIFLMSSISVGTYLSADMIAVF
jgi:hypothetical protein